MLLNMLILLLLLVVACCAAFTTRAQADSDDEGPDPLDPRCFTL
jgi:hypothetical protein